MQKLHTIAAASCIRQLSTRRRPRVVIVGAGVIGLSVGVCLTNTNKPVCLRNCVTLFLIVQSILQEGSEKMVC